MKFTRLRVLGFKSFVEPTEFLIEAGPDRRGRPERLRQIQSRRGASLGDGRELVPEHARVRHGRRDLLGQRQPSGAQHRRGHSRHRQCRPHRAGGDERRRPARGYAPHRARGGLGLQDQRPRRSRPRRAAPLRRRLDRRAFAGDGRPGQDRRADRRQAAATAARCSRRRPAFPASTTAATRPSFGCPPPSRTSPASTT